MQMSFRFTKMSGALPPMIDAFIEGTRKPYLSRHYYLTYTWYVFYKQFDNCI
jgi:hypothetical protein